MIKINPWESSPSESIGSFVKYHPTVTLKGTIEHEIGHCLEEGACKVHLKTEWGRRNMVENTEKVIAPRLPLFCDRKILGMELNE